MKNPQEVYHYIELSSEVMNASSHRRIQMLFEKSLLHLHQANNYILARNIPKKCESISKAMDIIVYLRACLNMQEAAAQDLSKRLEQIYLYVERKLLQANIKNDIEAISESVRLINTVKIGWDAISEEVKSEAST